ncbi:IPT/TIG domain-containing protein [Pedobacter sp. R-06]|uniref:IPT/TIG domain-containing protein n=1 Tax=Pedobacter sp. R-06 TaxID=3404051 RepID=UPI003CF2C8C6
MKRFINIMAERSHLLSCMICLLLLIAGCKKDKTDGYNPSSPIAISDFIPKKGGGGTEVLITGTNFTTDLSKISVILNDLPLKVIGASATQIMVVVPKKSKSGPLKVKIENKEASSEAIFNYEYTRTVTTLAGSGKAGFANGKGTDASFNFSGQNWYRSSGIVVDDQLNVYVADPGNHCIRKIDPEGNVSTLAGNPALAGYADGKGSAANFSLPYDLAIDGSGNLYCVDPGNWDIRMITPDGQAKTWGFGRQEPWSIAFDKSSRKVFYSSCSSPGSVYQIDAQGNTKETISGLNYPAGIKFDHAGNLFVSAHGDQVIRKFNAGTWQGSIVAGQQDKIGYINGDPKSAQFAYPWGIAVDNNDNIYVAGNGTGGGSTSNPDQSIRFIQANNYQVSTFAGSNTAGYTDGFGQQASFSAPGGVAVDKNGTVYVLDKNNNRIRKIISE